MSLCLLINLVKTTEPTGLIYCIEIALYRVSFNHMNIFWNITLHVKRNKNCIITWLCLISFRFRSNCLYVFLSKTLISLKLFERKSRYLVWLLLKCHHTIWHYNNFVSAYRLRWRPYWKITGVIWFWIDFFKHNKLFLHLL